VLDASAARVLKLSLIGQVLARIAVPGLSHPPDTAGLAVDPEGNLFVADARQRRIHKLAPSGAPLAQWEHRGSCPRCPATPAGLAVDAAGCLYVTDRTGPAVQKLSARGDLLAEWRGPDHFGLFHRPAAVALDARGCLYVADEGNHAVHRLSPAGEPVGYWGGEGERPGQLRAPRGLALDLQGNLYAADSGNARIQKLAPSRRCLAVWGSKGHGPGQLWTPVGIALDPAGCLYVADEGNGRILKLSPNGDPLAQWGLRHCLIARPIDELPTGEPDSWREGGYYSLELGPGDIAIARVLAADSAAVHVRLYRNRLPHRPKDDRVPPVTVGDPGDVEGMGQAHVAITPRLFAAWHPRFINKAQVKPRHLRDYRTWQAARGPVWDLDLAPERRG
jgi:sugar lactone lactonase YvrE